MRTAAGSSLWLRVESFRRFLAESEGYHADEAARRGVLREYTAWAVAVGEIGRWTPGGSAPRPSRRRSPACTTPTWRRYLLASTTSTATAPSSSGSGGGFGGGGFGGGSVGGGAGGGGGGSW